ncbi:hypothetical protein SFRURICE_001482 [Spodoptera frugiperda]|nr:hypothetical protein SFRURICE_001482 [Spodoptera frugiperda]
MSYPIKFLSLQKAESDYEVTVRGGTEVTTAMVPSATFHQLPSISYLPAATFHHLPTIYGSSTYLQSPLSTSTYSYHSTDYLPSSLLSESAGPRDFATFASKTAGLPCITDGWTTAELRATYPLYRLLTG